jgi:hypothetical protein
VPPPPPEEQQQLVQFIQKQAKLLEQARAIEAQQRATAAKVTFSLVKYHQVLFKLLQLGYANCVDGLMKLYCDQLMWT